MLKFMILTLILSLGIGCQRGDSVLNPEDNPLTVEQWQGLPQSQKYEAPVYERLKAGNTALRDERAWYKFNREVIMPQKKRDLPAPAK
jgi:hypothetical protein